MNPNELERWMICAEKNVESIESIIQDRKILKKSMTEFLKSYFDFDKIEFSTDLRTITLEWNQFRSPVIHHDEFKEFPMDFVIIGKDYGEAVVEVYPWGTDEDKVK